MKVWEFLDQLSDNWLLKKESAQCSFVADYSEQSSLESGKVHEDR
jgi:hypothetical protein